MSTVQEKFTLLQEVSYNDSHLDLMAAKLLRFILADYLTRLKPYQQALQQFEAQYNMPSVVFYPQFEQGLLGDNMDFFEWAGIFELQQALLIKIKRLELAL